jgi:hypothetical protein
MTPLFELPYGCWLHRGQVMDALTEAKIRLVGRLKANAKLDELAAPYLLRPVGHPPSQTRLGRGMVRIDRVKQPENHAIIGSNHIATTDSSWKR